MYPNTCCEKYLKDNKHNSQFNNLDTSSLPTKKYLEKLFSFHDFDLFSLNTASSINPDQNLVDLNNLLNELGYPFNIVGITETRITENDQSDYHPSIPGYRFEFAPTPLAAGGVGMFIDENVKYRVIEKISSRAFQALWVELQFERKSKVVFT